MHPSSPWPFPMECPACKAATGRPHRAEPTGEHGSIRVVVRCVLCNHEWLADLSGRNIESSMFSHAHVRSAPAWSAEARRP